MEYARRRLVNIHTVLAVKLPVGRTTDLPAKISKQPSLKSLRATTWQVARVSRKWDKSNIFMVYTVILRQEQVSPELQKHKCNLHKQIEKLDPMSGSEKLIGRPLHHRLWTMRAYLLP